MGTMRNAYRILVRKLDADPSGPKAREVPCYVVQVYFILTSIIHGEMLRKVCCCIWKDGGLHSCCY